MMAAAKTERKYRPHVRIVDAGQGLYTVQSERYTYVLYLVDVLRGTCECEAGQRQFKGVRQFGGACKHLHICRQYHTHRQRNLIAAQHAQTQGELAALAREFAQPVPTFDFRASRQSAAQAA